jgi:hypothetical protein
MAITEATRGCAICRAPLPDPPAAPVCAQCGFVDVLHHTQWPPLLKWWLLSELQVDSFAAYRGDQRAFEKKLSMALNGTSLTQPNPWGLPIATNTPAAELYPYAIERAGWWKSAGSPIARRVLAPAHDRNDNHERIA